MGKEATAFAKESTEYKENIDASIKAIAALEKGAYGAFLQTSGAAVLRTYVSTADLDDADREVLTAFLTQGEGYVPQSGQVIGMLKQMTDTMDTHLKEITAAEEKAKNNYKGLMAAKAKEVEALQKQIEEKIARLGEVGVELVNLAEELDDTKKSLAEDQQFLKDLETGCKTKEAEWEERCRVRADEMLALAETIKILNSDDALELFKKTLPTPSLLMVQMSSKAVQQKAVELLQSGVHRDYRLDLISMALRGRKVSFDKVIKMIDDMIALLGKEQIDDDEKKAYCEKEFDTSEDEKKALERAISQLDTQIEKNKAEIATLTDDIAELIAGIEALDKQVAEATAQRKEEHAQYIEDLAANNAAKELIEMAENRLNQFYNPKLYVPPPKRDLSEEERITVNMGGTLAPTAAPGGISGTGITAFAQIKAHEAADQLVAPAPPPETWDAYQKKGDESSGVIAMMNHLESDLMKQIEEKIARL